MIENLAHKWNNLSEHIRFLAIGSFGILLGWGIYNIIYMLMPPFHNRATITWSIAYFLAIIRQHALHFYFTFNNSDAPYIRSLVGAFGVYGLGWIGTTFVNNIFTSKLNINHQFAFFATTATGVALNYFLLKRIAFKGSPKDSV